MNLYTTDARPDGVLQNSKRLHQATINVRVLEQIEPELEEFEKVSILFLLTADRPNSYDTVLRLCRNMKNRPCIIAEYVQDSLEAWEKKFLEALCIIGNYEVLQNLGYPDCQEIFDNYQARTPRYAVHINIAVKVLYKLFEAMNGEKSALLLENIYSDSGMAKPLQDVHYLELHALYWLQQRYITIFRDGMANFENLLKPLKKLGFWCESIYHDVAHFSYSRSPSISGMDVPDSCSQGKIAVSDESREPSLHNDVPSQKSTEAQTSMSRTIKKGLCVIINQVYFPPPYKRREGSDSDRDNLRKTFSRMNFDILIRENLTKNETKQLFQEISDNFDDKKHDCLVVVLLSHGYEGGIVTCDGHEIPIKDIEDAVCSRKSRNAIKLLIVQACQGKNTGEVSEKSDLATDSLRQSDFALDDHQESDLSTDGPSENILRYKHFSRFMSTMDRFVSIRHKILGSWFIDAVCEEFAKGGKMSMCDWSRNVIANVQSREGRVDGLEKASQLPEFSTRLAMVVYFPPYSSDEATESSVNRSSRSQNDDSEC